MDQTSWNRTQDTVAQIHYGSVGEGTCSNPNSLNWIPGSQHGGRRELSPGNRTQTSYANFMHTSIQSINHLYNQSITVTGNKNPTQSKKERLGNWLHWLSAAMLAENLSITPSAESKFMPGVMMFLETLWEGGDLRFQFQTISNTR